MSFPEIAAKNSLSQTILAYYYSAIVLYMACCFIIQLERMPK